jgi:hypothetical protein
MYDVWVISDSIVKLVTVNLIIRDMPSNDQLGWDKQSGKINNTAPTYDRKPNLAAKKIVTTVIK